MKLANWQTATLGAIASAAAFVLLACRDGDDTSTPATQPSINTPAATATVTMVASDGTPTRRDGPGTPARFEVAFPQLPEFERPVVMLELPGQQRMLLVEQAGRIVTFANDPGASEVAEALNWVDRTSRDGNEEGLLGAALDPAFEDNGFVYLYYSARPGERRTQLSRFESAGTGADFRIDPASELPILTVPQPFGNHKGGALMFGPDEMLYLALGDGGSGGDPQGNGQDISRNLLGSIVRIDVRDASAQSPYTIPADNPFVGNNARAETWAFGLRNPWRMSFDRETGMLIAADVGQSAWEEIDIIERGGNYGWNIMEGLDCYSPRSGCDTDGLILPIAAYGRDAGCSVTGGYVYRGEAAPALDGAYLYADYCEGTVWSIPRVTQNDRGDPVVLLASGPQISSFAEDLNGELYLLSFDGRIYSVRP